MPAYGLGMAGELHEATGSAGLLKAGYGAQMETIKS
jgi:hypothetical protein